MPVALDSKKGSKSGKSKAKGESSKEHAAAARLSVDAAADSTLPEPIAYLGGKHRTERRRNKYHDKFEELVQVINAASPAVRALAAAEASSANATASGSRASVNGSKPVTSTSSSVLVANAFPTLSVGYLARAMGLNVSNQQIAAIVELIEEDGPSTGFVDKRKLEAVLVDALLTGTLGSPELRKCAASSTETAGTTDGVKLVAERLEAFPASLCVRDDEATLFRAFEALDEDRKGYLELEDFRTPMMTEGEKFSNEEIDEMWAAMRDPETNRVYYRDFADVLARE